MGVDAESYNLLPRARINVLALKFAGFKNDSIIVVCMKDVNRLMAKQMFSLFLLPKDWYLIRGELSISIFSIIFPQG